MGMLVRQDENKPYVQEQFLKVSNLEHRRHFLNGFQRAPFPSKTSFNTYIRLDIAVCCSVLRHLFSG